LPRFQLLAEDIFTSELVDDAECCKQDGDYKYAYACFSADFHIQSSLKF